MVLFLCYSLTQFIEQFLGIWILHKVYAEPRFRSKRMMILGGGLFLGVALLFVWNAWGSYVSNLAFLVGNILWASFYVLYFKCPFDVVYVWKNFLDISILLLKMPMLILTGLLQHRTLFEANRGGRNFAEVFWCLIIEILIFMLVMRRKDTIRLLRILFSRRKKLLIILFSIEWCMLTYSMYLGKMGFEPIDFVLHFIFIICVVLLMLYLMLNILYREIKSENTMLDTIQNNLQSQNEKLQIFYNQKNQQVHDVKHIMNYLRNCLENGKTQDA